ncbi:phosphoribosyltransferase family protein [Teredinibacter sp. KSP-S5-2]|uniref:phosphoribosyltransferase family protein n=1 Tax=Teredinibacter sp. KSP-S5-2 TaxID=3034506 RepID=UPI002934E9C1|nr:phosphoribosyltransferase family protein [Teredinibacter sp. KSP-S5-2]WNO07577.1 phosphoribosyltransferase family protein [Teredinibacter sp. KSP-S5-2]
MNSTYHEAKNAQQIFSFDEVNRAIQSLAEEINFLAQGEEYLVISLLNGATIFSGLILPHLTFPLKMDYIHLSRYQNNQHGGEIKIVAEPKEALRDCRVLLLDDICDEGRTLEFANNYCMQAGAKSVLNAVLARKVLNDPHKFAVQNKLIDSLKISFALEVPDVFVFGMGMDVGGYLRNMPGIFQFNRD